MSAPVKNTQMLHVKRKPDTNLTGGSHRKDLWTRGVGQYLHHHTLEKAGTTF